MRQRRGGPRLVVSVIAAVLSLASIAGLAPGDLALPAGGPALAAHGPGATGMTADVVLLGPARAVLGASVRAGHRAPTGRGPAALGAALSVLVTLGLCGRVRRADEWREVGGRDAVRPRGPPAVAPA